MNMKNFHMVAFPLVIIGALNWGLIGLFQFNLVQSVFGNWPMVEQLVYVLVGAAAVSILVMHKKDCKWCSKLK